MKQIIAIIIILWSCVTAKAQEWWQITPWAPDSNYIMGALPTGEATWVHKDSITTAQILKIDSIARVFYLTNGVDTVKFLDRGILTEEDGSTINELGEIFNQATTPISPKKGDTWFNTSSKTTSVYNGSTWVEIDNASISMIPTFTTNRFNLTYSHKGLSSINMIIQGANGVNINQGDFLFGNHAIFSVDSTWVGNIISDSLALITTEPDSIQRIGNTISLRDGDGSVDLSDLVNVADSTAIVDGWGITSVESPTNTYNLMADSSQVATTFDLTLKQDKLTGANKRIPYFTGTSTLSNSDNLVFDNATKYLGIGTASPDATIHMTQATGNRIRFTDPNSGTNYKNWQIFAGSGADERNLSFQSLSDAGAEYNFMTWRKGPSSQVVSNLYIPHLATSSGTEVLTMNTVGEVWKSGLNTINGSSLFGSGNITTGTFTLPSLTAGSVLFSNGSTISQDNTNFFWDDTNNRLGLGTTSPLLKGHITSGDIGIYNSLGGQIYLGDGNFENGSYFNSAPGIGAVGSAPTSNLGFFVYNGSPNARSEIMRLTSSGLGINTTSNSRTLDVNGEARIRDLTTTNPSGLVGRDGDGVLSGVTLGTGLSYTGTTLNATGVTGSGTTNYISKFTGSSSIGNSLLISNTDNVQLSYSNSAFARGFQIQNTSTSSSAITGLSYANSAGSVVGNLDYYPTNYANSSIQDHFSFNTLGTTSSILFNTNAAGSANAASGNIKFKIAGNTENSIFIKGSDGSGLVGINTSSPTRALDINGATRIRGALYSSGDSPFLLPTPLHRLSLVL